MSGTFLALFCLILELIMALKDQKSTGTLTDVSTIITDDLSLYYDRRRKIEFYPKNTLNIDLERLK